MRREGNLLGIPQRGIVRHSHSLQGGHPSFPKPMPLSWVDNRLHKIFSIRKALIVPLFLTSFKGRLEVSNFISLSSV